MGRPCHPQPGPCALSAYRQHVTLWWLRKFHQVPGFSKHSCPLDGHRQRKCTAESNWVHLGQAGLLSCLQLDPEGEDVRSLTQMGHCAHVVLHVRSGTPPLAHL